MTWTLIHSLFAYAKKGSFRNTSPNKFCLLHSKENKNMSWQWDHRCDSSWISVCNKQKGLNEINFFVDEEFRNTLSVFCKLSRICHPQGITENKRHQNLS